MRSLAERLYLLSLALLPWGRWLDVPALHENAQWSDVLFAVAAAAWLIARFAERRDASLLPFHIHPALLAALGGYVGWAALSHAAAGFEPRAGSFKLLGLAELALLLLVTSDLAARPGGLRRIARVVTGTSLAVAALGILEAAAAWLGHPLWPAAFGDLVPGTYARAQSGFIHPNLLGSYLIFASGVLALPAAGFDARARRIGQVVFVLAAALTLSREILGFALAALAQRATTPGRRRLAATVAALAAATLLAASLTNPRVDPTRPWSATPAPEASPRAQALATASRTLLENPLWGVGPGNRPAQVNGHPFDAHVTPLDVAATLGLPALLALAAIPFVLWRHRQRPTDRVVWGMLAGLALGALAQDIADFRHVWVALGLACLASPSEGRSPAERAAV